MTCKVVRLDDGTVMFQCYRGQMDRCYVCGNRASRLCDFPLRGEKAGQTCDKKLCTKCAVKVKQSETLGLGEAPEGEVFDFCPAHARLASRPK
jgi:hypothetical protein